MFQEHLELSAMHAPERGEFIPCPTTLMAQGSLYSSILSDAGGHFLELQKPPTHAASSETPLMSSVTAVEQQLHGPFSPSSSSCVSISQVQLAHYDLNCPPVAAGGTIKQEADSLADGGSAIMDDAMGGGHFLAPVHAVNCDGARCWDSPRRQEDWLPLIPNQFSACQQAQQNQQVMSIFASRLSMFRNPTVHNAGFGSSQQLGFPSSDSVISFDQDSRPDEDNEKIAKRQRRMIKNRESAARSRAKKQAHINYLQQRAEELVSQNEILRRELIFSPHPASEPASTRRQLRRTTSI